MHTGEIFSLAAGDGGRLIVTAAADKTARVWSSEDGHLVSTFLPPSSGGWDGSLEAAAMSPDAPIAAVAGETPGMSDNDDWRVYVFDALTGRIIRILDTGAGVPILDLKWSPDGQYLAAALSNDPVGHAQGIHVWRTDSWDSAASIPAPIATDFYNSISFDDSDRLVAADCCGWIDLYDAKFSLVAHVQPFGGRRQVHVAFSPDGSKVAAGCDSYLRVTILSGDSLSPLFTTRPSSDYALGTDIYAALAWSKDGSRLYAAGDFFNGYQTNVIRAWGDGGRGFPRTIDVPGIKVDIMAIVAMPGGGVAFGGGTSAWGILNRPYGVPIYRAAEIIRYDNTPGRLLLSPDGTSVAFTNTADPEAFEVFSLPNKQLTKFYGTPPGYVNAVTDPAQAGITDLETDAPKLNGSPLTFNDKPILEALQNVGIGRAIAKNQDGLYMVTDSSLIKFDLTGAGIYRVRLPADPISMTVSQDGRVIAVASTDGAIHFYRSSDLTEYLNLFVHPDGQRWIAWTPSGYYDASVNGDNLIAWVVNMGGDQYAHAYPVSHFSKQFFRPDVVAAVSNTLDEQQALATANSRMPDAQEQTNGIAQQLPPIVTIATPLDGEASAGQAISLHYILQSPSGIAITQLLVLFDGRPDDTDALQGISLPPSGSTSPVEGNIMVNPPAGTMKISLVPETAQNAGDAAVLDLQQDGPPVIAKPNLFVLAAGINQYADSRLKLNYSVQDAVSIAAAFQAHGGLYGHVEPRVLTDSEASRSAILTGLTWLQASSQPGDTVIIFLSGHGAARTAGGYYYLTQDTNISNLQATAVSNSDIIDAITKIRARVIVFLDTCHAGDILPAGSTDLVNELKSDESGAIVFASSTGNQESKEGSQWGGHGAFTDAIIKGVSGEADFTHRGDVTVDGLHYYLSDEVPIMTDKQQIPTFASSETATTDFPLSSD